MPKKMKLFLKDELTFIEKFYYLMDMLISNQQNFKIEAIFFCRCKLSTNIIYVFC